MPRRYPRLFLLILPCDDRRLHVLEVGHTHPDVGIDIRRIADEIAGIVIGHGIAGSGFVEPDRSRDVRRIVQANNIKPGQCSHKICEEDRPVFAVGIWITEQFVGEERFFEPKLILVGSGMPMLRTDLSTPIPV